MPGRLKRGGVIGLALLALPLFLSAQDDVSGLELPSIRVATTDHFEVIGEDGIGVLFVRDMAAALEDFIEARYDRIRVRTAEVDLTGVEGPIVLRLVPASAWRGESHEPYFEATALSPWTCSIRWTAETSRDEVERSLMAIWLQRERWLGVQYATIHRPGLEDALLEEFRRYTQEQSFARAPGLDSLNRSRGELYAIAAAGSTRTEDVDSIRQRFAQTPHSEEGRLLTLSADPRESEVDLGHLRRGVIRVNPIYRNAWLSAGRYYEAVLADDLAAQIQLEALFYEDLWQAEQLHAAIADALTHQRADSVDPVPPLPEVSAEAASSAPEDAR